MKKLKINIILIFIFISSLELRPQQNTDFFSNYTFFGANASVNYYEKGVINFNQPDCPVRMTPIHYASYMYGSVFRLYHNKHFLLSSGIYIRRLVTQESIVNLEEGQIPPDNIQDFITYYEYEDLFPVIPVRIDFRIYRNWYIYSSFDGGLYHRKATQLTYKDEDLSIDNYFPETAHRLRADLEGGIAYLFPAKFVLIQPYLYYNKSFSNTWEGEIYIKGIKNRDYTEVQGKIKESGNYWGLGLNLYPVKWKKTHQ